MFDGLTEDKRFKLDFNTAFKTGPARPHGIAMKIALAGLRYGTGVSLSTSRTVGLSGI